MDISTNITTVLEKYHERMAREAQLMQSLPREQVVQRRDEFMLSVGVEVARFLNTLVKASGARTILEIGTSYGYSTLWLAEAALVTGGKVITLEIDERKANYAREMITEAGLAETVEFRIGDALEGIREAKEQFDFVLVDVWKELYLPSFELFFPKLNRGAYVVADNMLHPPAHREEVKTYQDVLRATGAFDSVLLPIGSGIEVSYLR